MKPKLLIATHNPAKLAEYKKYLSKVPFKITSLKNLKIRKKIRETGKSFTENAILKATQYAQLSHSLTVADDGGLEIEALDGWPGIYSRRIKGKTATDQELIDYPLKKLKDLPWIKRKAKMRLVICLASPNGRYFLSKGEIKGYITPKPCKKIIKGFPFRSIFWIPRFKKHYVYLNKKEQELINHRKKALRKIIKILIK